MRQETESSAEVYSQAVQHFEIEERTPEIYSAQGSCGARKDFDSRRYPTRRPFATGHLGLLSLKLTGRYLGIQPLVALSFSIQSLYRGFIY